MSRLPYVQRGDLDENRRAIWDALVERHGERLVVPEGGLAGPFNAMFLAPHLALPYQGYQRAMETASIGGRAVEVAIITTAVCWKAEFEWVAHAERAREEGVAEDVIEAIGAGTDVRFTADDERLAHAVAKQLAMSGRIDDATYAEAQLIFGDVGLIELVLVCGMYALTSFLLNAFDVPPPSGLERRWA